jgi:2-isopropylmalate synthase
LELVLYDTTLRDGAQREGISFSLDDKLKIARRVDQLGIHYIEGGWPGSNPKDMAFFDHAPDLNLEQAVLVAFGSTRRAGVATGEDANIRAMADANTPAVAVVGKSWDLHVYRVLNTTLEENLRLIADSVRYFKALGREVIYDAEHFFDGYAADPAYAMQTLAAATEAGADVLVLCDTNGGCLPSTVARVVKDVQKATTTPLGIHAHNDGEMAVANSLAAVEAGAVHVQGTINGYGERCGNANLCSLIPAFKLKMGINCVSDEQLRSVTETARCIRTSPTWDTARSLTRGGSTSTPWSSARRVTNTSIQNWSETESGSLSRSCRAGATLPTRQRSLGWISRAVRSKV